VKVGFVVVSDHSPVVSLNLVYFVAGFSFKGTHIDRNTHQQYTSYHKKPSDDVQDVNDREQALNFR
jgi:hypothetical protein